MSDKAIFLFTVLEPEQPSLRLLVRLQLKKMPLFKQGNSFSKAREYEVLNSFSLLRWKLVRFRFIVKANPTVVPPSGKGFVAFHETMTSFLLVGMYAVIPVRCQRGGQSKDFLAAELWSTPRFSSSHYLLQNLQKIRKRFCNSRYHVFHYWCNCNMYMFSVIVREVSLEKDCCWWLRRFD